MGACHGVLEVVVVLEDGPVLSFRAQGGICQGLYAHQRAPWLETGQRGWCLLDCLGLVVHLDRLLVDDEVEDRSLLGLLNGGHVPPGEHTDHQEGHQYVRRGSNGEDAAAPSSVNLGQLVLIRLHEGTDGNDHVEQAQGLDGDLTGAGQDAVGELVHEHGHRQAEDAVPERYDRVDTGYAQHLLRLYDAGRDAHDDEGLPDQQREHDEHEDHDDADGNVTVAAPEPHATSGLPLLPLEVR